VTTVVLGNSEQSQFNSDLSLTARIKLTEVADLTGGYGGGFINNPPPEKGGTNPPPPATSGPEGPGKAPPAHQGATPDLRPGRQAAAGPVRHLAVGSPGDDRDLATDLGDRGGAQPGAGPRGHQHPADRPAEQRGGQ